MTGVAAAVMTVPGAVELREFPRPEPEPGAVVLDMRLSGICGTDKHTFRGESCSTPERPTSGRSATP